MEKFIIKELTTDNIEQELQNIGFDNEYRFSASDKFKYKNIKIFDLKPEQANILKQTALTVGADCATHREVIKGNIEHSNVILGGSISQIKKITEKLKKQPFNLKELSENIIETIQPKQRCTKLAGILNITHAFLPFLSQDIKEQRGNGVIAEVEVFQMDTAPGLSDGLEHIRKLILARHQQFDLVALGEMHPLSLHLTYDEGIAGLGGRSKR